MSDIDFSSVLSKYADLSKSSAPTGASKQKKQQKEKVFNSPADDKDKVKAKKPHNRKRKAPTATTTPGADADGTVIPAHVPAQKKQKMESALEEDNQAKAKTVNDASKNQTQKEKQPKKQDQKQKQREDQKQQQKQKQPKKQDQRENQKQNQDQKQPKKQDDQLTSMQQKMKSKLEGARFRWINEQLYTTSGQAALEMMEEDPSVFDEYHTGFRSQAASWPTNPLQLIIKSLQDTLDKNALIADLGCGDAQLAQTLIPKSYKVVSYDLVAPNSYISVAQCCSSVPLPGDDKGTSSVCDAVVCCLSLMGTDWPCQILEAHRILKSGGILKVAEVSSRFTNVDDFEKAIVSWGFELVNKDASNTHFVLFDFKKNQVPDRSTDPKASAALLKPCIYKKRG